MRVGISQSCLKASLGQCQFQKNLEKLAYHVTVTCFHNVFVARLRLCESGLLAFWRVLILSFGSCPSKSWKLHALIRNPDWCFFHHSDRYLTSDCFPILATRRKEVISKVHFSWNNRPSSSTNLSLFLASSHNNVDASKTLAIKREPADLK